MPGGAYWFVVAHAGCDATKTATTAIRFFTTNVSNGCGNVVPAVTATSPANGATNVAATTELVWTAQGPIESFDVYFGTSPTPSLLRGTLPPTTRSLALPSLASGVTYYWRIVAIGACVQQGGLSTPLQSFTTRADCPIPGITQILFAPASISAGATYAIVWSPATSLGADGGYLVERSRVASFGTILDAQVTSSTAASFLAQSPGTIYHRVRAVPGCDPTRTGPVSDVVGVTIGNAPPNVIFTVQPQAVVTSLGDRLEDQRGSFALENLGASALQVIVGRQEIGSAPFFSIVDDAAFITLQPHKPRTFALRYSGPRADVAGSYQGVIFVAAQSEGWRWQRVEAGVPRRRLSLRLRRLPGVLRRRCHAAGAAGVAAQRRHGADGARRGDRPRRLARPEERLECHRPRAGRNADDRPRHATQPCAKRFGAAALYLLHSANERRRHGTPARAG